MKRPATDDITIDDPSSSSSSSSSSNNDTTPSSPLPLTLYSNPTRRSTRSMSRRLTTYLRTTHARQRRAINPTPFESALSIVLNEGFLYRYDCGPYPLALVSKGCNDVWRDVEKRYPLWAEMRVLKLDKVGIITACRRAISEELITSTRFLRTVFDKINNLRVSAQPTRKKRTAAEKELLRWGVDVHVCTVSAWGPNEVNGGGIHIGFGRKNCNCVIWTCRLHPDLRLMTGLTKRGWRIYDGEPLWP